MIYVLEKLYPVLLEKPLENEMKELENFRVDDLMTNIIMLAYMEDNLFYFIDDYKTSREMFDANKARYDVNTTTHMYVLLQQYSTLKLKLDSITDHINKMLVMTKNFSVFNNPIVDATQISTILHNLPPS